MNEWLVEARQRVVAEPAEIARLFPMAGRACGYADAEAARVALLTALPLSGVALVSEVDNLYRYGDAAEKRAVLRALPLLEVGSGCVELLQDAIRTNDTRLVAAAMGPYSCYLDGPTWRQAVLKCVFVGLPLSVVDGIGDRADQELAAMLRGYVDERRAAGRAVPDDVVALLTRLADARVP